MQLTLWDDASIGRLQKRDEGAWMVFLPQAIAIARHVLRTSVDQADLEDECTAVAHRLLIDLPKWDSTRGQCLESYVTRKALDRRIRYSESRKGRPKPISLDKLQEDGIDQPAPDLDTYTTVERNERSAAILVAMTQLDAQEYLFLRLRDEGYPLAEAASAAGYSNTDLPENVIRRIKRKLASLLREQPFFRDNPEELALIGDSSRYERNDDARLHR